MQHSAHLAPASFDALVPRPTRLHPQDGSFVLPETLSISAPDPSCLWLGPLQEDLLRLGIRSTITSDATNGSPGLTLRIDETTAPESSLLNVSESGITLTAATERTLVTGVQRLRAVLHMAPAGRVLRLPCVRLEDTPRYSWRGMHLDCARHFMPVDFILLFLDRMSLLGYNRLHWHLTDDQGWRLEIPGFPALTSVGAVRRRSHIGKMAPDGSPQQFNTESHGGFYRAEDVARIVAHASARGITVMPEIEMPGHSTAALAAYPEWGCQGKQLEVADYWGIFPNLLCAGNDRVLRSLEDILTHVTALFPSPYIHLGGDECPLGDWDTCPKCQDRIARAGLVDSHGLHAWFFRHFQNFLRDRGRTMVIWDDVLDAGDIGTDAVIMCWRSAEAVAQAAERGHRVINCTHTDTYFNKYQTADPHTEGLAYDGYLPIERVRAFQPGGEAPIHFPKVLGAQGHLWSEYMPTPADVTRMAFPRMIALIERLWSDEPTVVDHSPIIKTHGEFSSLPAHS